MKTFCSHYSFENKCCKFLYEPKNRNFYINLTDLIPNCDGLKSPALCCWYNVVYGNSRRF